jgi:hypothetical protein
MHRESQLRVLTSTSIRTEICTYKSTGQGQFSQNQFDAAPDSDVVAIGTPGGHGEKAPGLFPAPQSFNPHFSVVRASGHQPRF